MRRLLIAFLVPLFLFAAPPAADPQKAGMDPQRLAQIAERMKEFEARGQLAGSVTLLQRHGALAHFEATGWADIEAKKPMQRDTIFQIMSMTKPITGVAIMMLADEGKLRVTDPVEMHLPEFRGQMMIAAREGDKLILQKPPRPITIRDLMTHTSGMISVPPESTGPLMIKMDMPLDRAVAIYAQQPLDFAPGTKWQYSNPGIATLGRIVEVLSGMKYEEFLAKRIFEPLGMVDSSTVLPESKHARLAALYTVKGGHMVKDGPEALAGDAMKFRKGAVYSGPEFSVYTTAADLAKFYQMMLDKGVCNGQRLLSAAAVETMTSLQTGDLHAGWTLGGGYALTWEVTKDPIGTLTGLSLGSFHHGGAFSTFGYIDPKRDLIGVYMTQWSSPGGNIPRETFTELGAASIVQ